MSVSWPMLNFDRRGEGEPLVLIHGVGSRWQVWEPVLDLLSARRDVISLDLPGHGRSPVHVGTNGNSDDAPYSPKGLARTVAAFLDELGLEKAHLAGNSLGGWISLELAKMDRAISVTGLSPAGLWRGSPPVYIGAVFFAGYAATAGFGPFAPYIASDGMLRSLVMGQYFGRPWKLTPQQAVMNLDGFVNSPGVPRVLEDGAGLRFTDGKEIDAPVTVAFGNRESVLLPYQSQERRELPSQTRWLGLRGCGHVPIYDDPELVANVISDGSSEKV